jgi:acetyl esterase/lipase
MSVCFAILLLAAPARAEETVAKKYEVRRIRDLIYFDGEGADTNKHKLDLYLPRDHKDFPVLFFVHGGAWTIGDRNFFGVYSSVAMLFARHGIGTAVTSYRLSPAVQHPEHIKDVARAFAWTHKHIGEYGGRNDQIFISGHSAGGHLVALLATDDSYLKALGLGLKDIKGAMPMSGVYNIPNRFLSSVFTDDSEVRRKASPLTHVRGDAPPFLIIYAEKDLIVCGKQPSEEFCAALNAKKCTAESLEVKSRTHVSLLLKTCLDDDPAAQAMLRFIMTRVSTVRSE